MPTFSEAVFELLNDEANSRGCSDLSDEAYVVQPKSYTLQLLAQLASKCGDTLSSSRIVLPWLLSSIGAPAFFIAWLVPIRESLSLIPQLAIAAILRRRTLRKPVYVFGAGVQGLLILGMPLALLLPNPSLSATAILAALALYSVARGLCSVAAKDVLGKTVEKGHRGRLGGIASSVAGMFSIGFGFFLLMSGGDASLPLLVSMLCCSGALWVIAALLYSRVPEKPGATEDGVSGLKSALKSTSLLQTDATLRAFVITRILLVSTAYAIPFLVVMVFTNAEGSTRALALVILAEGLAAMTSGAIWGIYSDRASHRVLAASGLLTALTLGVVLLSPVSLITAANGFAGAVAIYVAAVAHQGTRLGRKTYIVDLANSSNRATYVAVSNTVIGLFVLLGGGLGWIAQHFGTNMVLATLLVMATTGAVLSIRLKPV